MGLRRRKKYFISGWRKLACPALLRHIPIPSGEGDAGRRPVPGKKSIGRLFYRF
jgi:hypothetical protein